MSRVVSVTRLSLALLFISIFSAIRFVVWLQGQYVVPILMYHSISSYDKSPISLINAAFKVSRLNSVSPQSFDHQMAFLKNNGYKIIPLDEYVQGDRVGRKFPHNTVVITFDDGFKDNYDNAFPILKKYNIPATIFLITDLVGQNKNLLNWDQVKVMSQWGITFGSHTRRHAYIPNLNSEQMKDEIVTSKHILEEHLGKPVTCLAYPVGGFTEQAKAIAALAGYKAALTTNRGTDRYDIDLYELSRIHVDNKDNDIVLRTKVSGFYNLFRQLKPSH